MAPHRKQATWHNALFWKPVLLSLCKLESSKQELSVTFVPPHIWEEENPWKVRGTAQERNRVLESRWTWTLSVLPFFVWGAASWAAVLGISKLSSQK